jgi:hypothetical protein
MMADLPEGWTDALRHFIRHVPETLDESRRC